MSTAQARARAVVRPNTLAKKAGPGKGIDAGKLALADQVIVNMSDHYMDHAADELERLEALVDTMENAADDAARADAAKAIYAIVHEMRGEAGTFGYDLASRVGTAFCRYIDALERIDAAAPVVARHHSDSLRAIIAGRIKGDGGKVGKALIHDLGALIKRFSP